MTTTVTAATVIATAIAQRDRERWARHSREVARLAREAQILSVNRETAVRGFLLSGDSVSLEPDIAARVPLRATLDSILALTADNPAQRRRARALAAAVARWDSAFARPTVARRLTLDPGATAAVDPLAGKLLFDEIRARYAEFEFEEELLFRARDAARSWSQSLNVAITIVGLTLLVVVEMSLRRRVVGQAAAIVERQTLLEEQATEMEEQAAQLEEQSLELQAHANELNDTVHALAQKNEDLNLFSASVAHDLRSPLRSIDGFSHLLLTEEADRLTPDGVKALERIRANTRRMGELIDGMLSLARVSASELRKTDVNLSDVASSVASDLQRMVPSDRPPVAVDVQPGLRARGDVRLLRIALTNLLDNAIKFTRSRADARVQIGVDADNGDRRFYVADNGIGFDMRYATNLFGAFERLHDDPRYEGTGIGLATVRRIIERHGGRLWADAEPGRGATFYFTLPGDGAPNDNTPP